MHLDLDLPICTNIPISDQSSATVLQAAFTVRVTKVLVVTLPPAWEGIHRGTENTSTTQRDNCWGKGGEQSEENTVLISFSF